MLTDTVSRSQPAAGIYTLNFKHGLLSCVKFNKAKALKTEYENT